jgi:uncharacterized OB-fold protein
MSTTGPTKGSSGSSLDAPSPSGAPLHSVEAFTHGYEEEGRLLGYACSKCGFRTLSFVLVCPRCHGRSTLEDRAFSGKGKVVSYTLQHVPSDEFVNEAPYAYAIVELEEGLRVSGWLPQVKSERDLSPGDKVHWVSSYRRGMVFEKESATGEP